MWLNTWNALGGKAGTSLMEFGAGQANSALSPCRGGHPSTTYWASLRPGVRIMRPLRCANPKPPRGRSGWPQRRCGARTTATARLAATGLLHYPRPRDPVVPTGTLTHGTWPKLERGQRNGFHLALGPGKPNH